MSITLSLRNREQLKQLLADQQNPSSPEYHHFLTPAEFAARFGPTNLEAAREWLTGRGFKLTSSGDGRRVIGFTGTVEQAERAFGVSIESFGGAAFANTSDPQIPARFAGVIGHIHGLDNMSGRRPGVTRSNLKPAAAPDDSASLKLPAFAREASGDQAPGSEPEKTVAGYDVPHIGGPFFGPTDFYRFYDETPLLSAGLKGSGCIALIGDSKVTPSAISTFASKFKVGPAHLTTVLVDSGDPGFNNDEIEAELDLEWSHAIAPGAASRLYVGNDRTALVDPIVDALEAAVNENKCKVISISFGFCGVQDSAYTEVLDPLFAQAAAQGQSVITITHDFGAVYLDFDAQSEQCVPGGSRAVSEMAADPNVTAISGTSFNPNWDGKGNITGPVAERVWNDSNDGFPNDGATGGGVSRLFEKPDFQTGNGVPADGMRDIPDVSLIASPHFPGSWIVTSSSCFTANGCTGKGGLAYGIVGGTSLSAPAFAGVVNLIGQATGQGLGNVDPTIYSLANQNLAGSGFRDVTNGNNDFNGVTGFTAGADYDLATGWGSIDVATFVSAYAGTLPGPPTATLSPAQVKFPLTRAGTTSKPKTVTIIVPKGQPKWARIDSVSASGDFTAAQTCVGTLIAPGKNCKFGVTFSAPPEGAGPSSATLTVTDNSGNSPHTISLIGSIK